MADPPSEPVRTIGLKSAPAGYRAPFPWRAAALLAAASVLGLSAALVLSGWGPEAARMTRTLWRTEAPAPASPPRRLVIPAQMPAVSGVDSTRLVPLEPTGEPPSDRIPEADPAPRAPPPVSLQDSSAGGGAAPVRSKPAALRSTRAGELSAPGSPADLGTR